jgi:hypothetical protein
MKNPLLIGGLTLAGLFVAYEVWGRTPGDKAAIGDVVRVDVKDVSLSPAARGVFPGSPAFPGGFAEGTFLYLLVTAINDSTGEILGRIVRVQFEASAVEVKNVQLPASTNRKAVLPLAYGAKPVPVTVI